MTKVLTVAAVIVCFLLFVVLPIVLIRWSGKGRRRDRAAERIERQVAGFEQARVQENATEVTTTIAAVTDGAIPKQSAGGPLLREPGWRPSPAPRRDDQPATAPPRTAAGGAGTRGATEASGGPTSVAPRAPTRLASTSP